MPSVIDRTSAAVEEEAAVGLSASGAWVPLLMAFSETGCGCRRNPLTEPRQPPIGDAVACSRKRPRRAKAGGGYVLECRIWTTYQFWLV